MQKNIQEKDTHEKKENRILIKLHRKKTHTHTKMLRLQAYSLKCTERYCINS